MFRATLFVGQCLASPAKVERSHPDTHEEALLTYNEMGRGKTHGKVRRAEAKGASRSGEQRQKERQGAVEGQNMSQGAGRHGEKG